MKIGSQGWVPGLGPIVRYQVWVSRLGTKASIRKVKRLCLVAGSHGWVPRLGSHGGSQDWAPRLGHKVGSPRLGFLIISIVIFEFSNNCPVSTIVTMTRESYFMNILVRIRHSFNCRVSS